MIGPVYQVQFTSWK